MKSLYDINRIFIVLFLDLFSQCSDSDDLFPEPLPLTKVINYERPESPEPEVPLTQVEKIKKRQLEERQLNLERYTQIVSERFPKIHIEPAQYTQEQNEMREALRRAHTVRPDIEMSLYDQNLKSKLVKDETPPEVKKLCLQKGFLRASEVHCIMSQSGPSTKGYQQKVTNASIIDEEIELRGLTQILNDENLSRRNQAYSSSSNPTHQPSPSVNAKVVQTIAEAIMDDFEDIDDEVLTVVDEQIKLNQSLETLKTTLNNSQNVVRMIESALSQSSSTNINGSRTYMNELCDDDDEEMKFTEQLEEDFINIKFTEQLEEDFLNISHADLTPPKANKLTFNDSPCCSKSLDKSNFQMSSGIGNTGMFSGFSFTSGQSDVLKEPTRKQFEVKENLKVKESLKDAYVDKSVAPVGIFPGFGKASGKSVATKNSILSRFKHSFDRVDQSILEDLSKQNHEFDKPADAKPFKVPSFSPAVTKVNNLPSFSTPNSSKSDFKLAHSFKSTPEIQKAPVFVGFASSAGASIKLKNSNLKRFAEAFENEDLMIQKELGEMPPVSDVIITPDKPPLKKHRLDFGSSPISPSPFLMERFKSGINQHSTPLVSKSRNKVIITDSQEVSSINELLKSLDDVCDDVDLIASPKRKKPVQTRLLNKFNKDDNGFNETLDMTAIESIAFIESLHKTSMIISDGVQKTRKRALEEQKEMVKDKLTSDKMPMAGSLLMMKSSKNRKTMSEYVKPEKPTNLNRHQVTSANAIEFKFSLLNYYNEEICRTSSSVTVGDNARLVMDEKSQVGINEIMWCFLASPGVDPQLATEAWIENSFKMIVLKLAWLENSFERFDKFELLSPDNILLQLKYRYDREIDKSERSAIRKIVELDDVPCRRMVLKVSNMFQVPGVGYELELTDGWYSIRTTIDASLADAYDRGKIKIGTKLLMTNAEIKGCGNGFDPLIMPNNVRLKIHANSTRRTTWDQKMGFCKNPSPFYISLDSVLTTGGAIGRLRLVVTHVYPILYVDSSGEKKGKIN